MLNTAYFAWEHLELQINGITIDGIQGLEINDEQVKEYVYGRGTDPLAIRRGNKSFSGSLTVLQGDYERLRQSVVTGSILDLRNGTLTASLSNGEGDVITYALRGLEFTQGGLGTEQGQTSITRNMPFMCLGITVQ